MRTHGAALAATLALCACSGPDLISLGGALPDPSVRYLSPAGDDHNLGTSESPWKTFRFALTKLVPGSTLRLLNGTYEASTTGTLNVRCGNAPSTGSTVPDAIQATPATPALPITVRADSEHQAFLLGDGHVPPISIDSCESWVVQGIHAESVDAADATTVPDTGSVVVLDGPNDQVTLSRLLVLHPNHTKHAQAIRIGDGASNVTVKECELYDFHESGIEARRSEGLVITRNYLNAREPAGDMDHDPTRPPMDPLHPRANYGVLLEETRDVYVLNNIAEEVSIGFGVVGRNADANVIVPLTSAIDRNSLRGNIVFNPPGIPPSAIGFRIDSQCQRANPCDTPHTVSGTDLTNDVVYRADQGVSDAGSVGTTVAQLSILEPARGISVARELPNLAIPANTMTTSTLVSAFQSVAFDAGNDTAPTFTHCDAAGGYDPTQAYRPDDPMQVKDKVTVASDLGACIAYQPMLSQLRTAGVGANVFFQYDDNGQLTTSALWLPAFEGCGAAPIGAVSNKPTCADVNVRLQADTPDCPPPL